MFVCLYVCIDVFNIFVVVWLFFFFFKQKTAYEMRISDWSSDVCSSDLTLALAQKLGLDPQKFFDIASVSSGQCWSLTSYAPLPGVGPTTPADNDYKGGFAAALMLKDLRLAIEAAASVDADVPMGMKARELYEAFVEADRDGRDFSAIIKTLQG